MYELPGTLLSTVGIGIAEMSWGAFLALTGLDRSRFGGVAATSRLRHPRRDANRIKLSLLA